MESGLLAFLLVLIWVDGAEIPLVRFISTSDPKPKAKSKLLIGNSLSYISQRVVVGEVCIGTFSLFRFFSVCLTDDTEGCRG